jgi:hypothetical protein
MVTRSEAVSATKNLPSGYENLTLTPWALARWLRKHIQPAKTLQSASTHIRYEYASLVSSVSLNSSVRNVRFARDENEIIPFGRFKQSGVALQMGMAGLEEFLERKTFVVPVPGAA